MNDRSDHNSVLQCISLTKVFRDFWNRAKVLAVENLTLDVQPGEIFGLLGPNGSGKSTTIKILLGLLYPTSGAARIFGSPPTDVAIRSRIGFMPEESYLYKYLNARETLDYIFEPSAEDVFEDLLPRWAIATFRLFLLEAFTSEHGARMIAMKNATDNAEGLLKALTQQRNKVRQAAITRELSEIVGTAEALK